MIASRKLERLSAAVDEMRQCIPEGSPARLEYVKCNIREEDQVGLIVIARYVNGVHLDAV